MNKKKLINFVKDIIPYIVVILIVVILRSFIITPARVDGNSMNPTLYNNDLVLLNKLDYRLNDIKRFDVVVVDIGSEKLIKRVIGLPGEHIEYKDNNLYVDGVIIKENFAHKDTDDFKLQSIGYLEIPGDMYFVVGDNRSNSSDSRMIGLMEKKQILGSVSFRFFPLSKIDKIK